MAEGGEKTEAPTPRRRQEARDQGNIARSPDLAGAAAVVGGMMLLARFGDGLASALRDAFMTFLTFGAGLQPGDWSVHILRQIFAVGLALAPICLGLMLIAVLINGFQTGFQFNPARLTPNLGALNPLRGLGSLLGRGRGQLSVLINLAKFALIGYVAYTMIRNRVDQLIASQALQYQQVFFLAATIVYAVAVRIGELLLLLAALDYLYQRNRIERQLRMSKQEVKDEMRSMDGDPAVKHRRRQLAITMHKQRLKKAVPTADVIVTNPTHFAIAIRYDPEQMNAPKVVAKGAGELARHIREIAIAHGIPILERKPLARALYKLVEVGQEIPEQFYSAVAEILAYVFELSGKVRLKPRAAAAA